MHQGPKTMEGLHSEAGYMTASVPKRVVPLESPLTARAGPYMYLQRTDKPTVCPSNDSARLLSYQSLPPSSEVWRGHGQEAKRGEVGGPRITRNVKRWSCFSSHV